MRACDQKRRPVPGRVDGGNHCNVDIAGPFAQEPGGLLLVAGRNRIDIEIIGIAVQVWGNGMRRLHARGGGDGRDDNIRLAHGIGG